MTRKEGAFFRDITAEEAYLLEHCLSTRPGGERTFREELAWLSEKIIELAEKGEVVSCYSEAAEHALHPDGYGWADSMSAIPAQRVGTNQAVNQEVA